jgi:hypothetical protein
MYDDKHMLKVVQHAIASALKTKRHLRAAPKLDEKQQRFSQNVH